MMKYTAKPKPIMASEYWYFTTHGVQPGSVPKGINILEVKDASNGSYFKTDTVIRTKNLDYYDIKECRPSISASRNVTASVDWSYYDKFQAIEDEYLPPSGEGDSLATQLVTAVTKIVYRWYNDGDVYDNQYGMEGWANDLSPYANWIYNHSPNKIKRILKGIELCYTEDDYEELLQDLADACLDEQLVQELANRPAEGSIYSERGPFKFVEHWDDDEEEEWDDDEEEEWDDEYESSYDEDGDEEDYDG